MAEKADCPVVPVTIMNSDQLLEDWPGFSIKKANVKIIYGDPVYVKDLPKGCGFGPRCPQFSKECEGEIPERVVRCGTVRCIKCSEEIVRK